MGASLGAVGMGSGSGAGQTDRSLAAPQALLGGRGCSRSCTTSERLEALYDPMGGPAFLEPTQGPLA